MRETLPLFELWDLVLVTGGGEKTNLNHIHAWIQEALAHCRLGLKPVEETMGRETTNGLTIRKVEHMCPIGIGPSPSGLSCAANAQESILSASNPKALFFLFLTWVPFLVLHGRSSHTGTVEPRSPFLEEDHDCRFCPSLS